MTLREVLENAADPHRAEGMQAYMKHHFRFLGVPAPARKQAQRAFVNRFATADGDTVLGAAEALWAEPEREFQYVAADLLRRRAKVLQPAHLERLRALVTAKSWWDTVDVLAAHAVGPLVREHGLGSAMDTWIHDADLWVARTAILHQLTFKDATDEARLFRYCAVQAGHADFFVRKAIGWALREYARTAPEAVRGFVGAHAHELSGLSTREALKHLGGTA